MADKQRAYDARKNTDLFADDDPLAELARIVGFEPRVAANTVPDVPRQEPAFNLEDELLREFERYDAPHAPAVIEQPIAAFVEPVAAIDEPAYEEPAYEEPSVPQWDVQQDVEFAQPVEAQPVHPLLSSTDWAVPRPAEPVSSGARDLIEELEMSIGATPAPASASAQPQKAPQWSAASIRLPLANFHTARRDQPVAPVVAPTPAPVPEPVAVAAEPVAEFPISEFPVAAAGFPAEIDRHEQVEFQPEEVVAAIEPIDVDHSAFDLAAAAKEGEVHADAALTEAAPAEFDDITFDIDDLLADVSSYPMPERQAAAPVAEPSPVHIPQPAAVAAMPERAPELKPAARTDAEAEDPFAGHDFELDLEGIELELADLDFVEPTVAREVEAPRPAAPAPVAQRPAPAPIAFAPVQQAPAPVYREPVVTRAPAEPVVAPMAAPTVAYGADAADELPFDLSMISDAEYHPETVEEMHVPALPPVEQHQPVVTTSDFDFDVDSEIANLLTPAKAVETVAKPMAEDWRTRAPIAAPAAAAVAPKQPLQQQTFDEFERALEEDFRRSVNEPVQQRRESISEVQIQSASDAEDMNRARSMKRMLAAAAVIVVFGGAAYAGYSFLARDGGLGIVSGEPRVITADKDPVKVVPENPGGKTVPNQDKAVYDSVGGAAAEAPKQRALVSSDEQPVDVVQRTLTPETMPEDNDSDTPLPSMATPVGDTQDPRLLPNHDATETAADDDAGQSGQNPAVSARKVRTMIVKPDGTLVAREEVAPEPAQADLPKPTSVQTQKITPGAAPASAAPASGQVATADIRSTPVENAKPSPAQTSENVLAKAAAATPEKVEPPVRTVTSTKSDTAPVPAGRPAAQAPATPAPAAEAPAAPKEVAAVPPAAPQPTAAVAGGYGVQIASLPSEAEAKKTFASLSKKFPGVLSGRNYEVRKAEIAGKGTFYRLRIPAGSKDEAAAICEKYRAAGGSCLISK